MQSCVILFKDISEALKIGHSHMSLRFEKCNAGCSGYGRPEQEMSESHILRLSIPLPQVQGLYDDIECRQVIFSITPDTDSEPGLN
ncbi:hypothetical protein TNCV_2658581 [Trichonephila clavipes]|nr:hypothetical protein TNCV_2658581 [Trichonephila clavipes]